MNEFYDKANLPTAILHFGSGILCMLSAFFLFFNEEEAQILFAIGGLFLVLTSIMIFFGEKTIKRFLMPITYFLLAILFFIAMARDISKEYFGLGFTAELLSGILFLGYGIIAILKEFFNYKTSIVKMIEVITCFIQAACVFFILFSYSSFGYRHQASIEVFYLVIMYLSFTLASISNTLYPAVLEEKKKKQ